MEPSVHIQDLVFYRQGRRIFGHLNLNIRKGKVTAIMGPSGTGKTTLLKLIGGQLSPQSGVVQVFGENIHTLNRDKLFALRRQMGMLFQSSALFTNLTVNENVAFPLRVHTHLSERMIKNLVLMKLEVVGLRGAKDLMPAELSGGMARRVVLARAATLDPQLIIYDEPFTGLDPIAKGVIVKLIRDLNDALHVTTILVSHDVKEAMDIADDVYVLSGGRLIGEGTPAQLRANEDPEIKQFILGLPDGVVPFHYPAKDYHAEIFHEAMQ